MTAFMGMLKFQPLVKAVIVIVTSHSPVVSQSRVFHINYICTSPYINKVCRKKLAIGVKGCHPEMDHLGIFSSEYM